MIFLDTSFLVAIEVETDQNHEKAVKVKNEIIKGKFGKIFISDYIFDETITVTFSRTKDIGKAVFAGTVLKNSSEMLKVDEKNFEGAWAIFKRQKGTKLSFTDCTTLSLMNEEGIKNIATFDKDFSKVNGINVIANP